MSHWTLRLLGATELGTAHGTRALRLARKAQALLACVVASGQAGVPRDRLLALLWPDQRPADARNALRQCLHHVRTELGDAAGVLASEGERIVIDAQRCDVDVWRFERLASAGDVDSLVAAVHLYRGEFAEGVQGGVDLAHWVEVERERLRDAAQRVVAGLAERAQEPAVLDAAARLARQLLTADPVHEGATRALMRLYERLGLRAKALHVFDECRRALHHDLGVEPSTATSELASALARSDPARVAGEAVAVTPFGAAVTTPPGSPLRTADEAEVLDLMLRGWQLFTTYTAQGQSRARRVFAQVVAREPRHADALSLLGWTHFFEAVAGWGDDAAGSLERAGEFGERALAVAATRARPHALLGKVLLWRQRHAEARAHLQEAVALEPGYGHMHFHLGDLAMWEGRHVESLAHVDRALQLEPNEQGVFLTVRGMALWMAGEPHAAAAAAASALRRNPSYPWAHGLLVVLHHERGDAAAAGHAAQVALRLNRRFSVEHAVHALPFGRDEHRERFARGWRAAGMPDLEPAAVTAPD